MELLIGAVVSAILLAALYGVFHTLLRTQSQSHARIEEAAPRELVAALFKRDLQNMVVPNGVLSGAVLGITEERGDAHSDSLEFYATTGKVDATAPWADIQKIEYYLAEPETGERVSARQLMRSVTRALLATTIEEARETTPLLDGVYSLEFKYFDSQLWLDSWDSTTMDNRLPQAVSVRITLDDRESEQQVGRAPIEVLCETVAQSPTATSGTAQELPG